MQSVSVCHTIAKLLTCDEFISQNLGALCRNYTSFVALSLYVIFCVYKITRFFRMVPWNRNHKFMFINLASFITIALRIYSS